MGTQYVGYEGPTKTMFGGSSQTKKELANHSEFPSHALASYSNTRATIRRWREGECDQFFCSRFLLPSFLLDPFITFHPLNDDFHIISQLNHHVKATSRLWTHIFHVRPHSIDEIHFYLVKILLLEKSELPLILFYFKGKIKQEIKP